MMILVSDGVQGPQGPAFGEIASPFPERDSVALVSEAGPAAPQPQIDQPHDAASGQEGAGAHSAGRGPEAGEFGPIA